MSGYSGLSEDYPEPLDGPNGNHEDDQQAEESHDVPGSKRGSKDTTEKPKRKRSCPVYFGVKSYLHNFYDDHHFKDPSLYEDDDHQYLLQPNQRRRRCTPIWWKIFMWIGVILLIFGVVSILIGYLVPPKRTLIGSSKDNTFLERKAMEYDATLDLCKLIGLILFCIGGVTLAMSLLFPSFLIHYCDEDEEGQGDDPAIKVPLHQDGEDTAAPLSPLQMTIPASSKVKNVQPDKKAEQQMLTHTPQPDK